MNGDIHGLNNRSSDKLKTHQCSDLHTQLFTQTDHGLFGRCKNTEKMRTGKDKREAGVRSEYGQDESS